jgi:PAS domain S-box-containing protein
MYRKKFEELIEKGGTYYVIGLISVSFIVDILNNRINFPLWMVSAFLIPIFGVTIMRNYNWFNIRDSRGITVFLYHVFYIAAVIILLPPGSSYVFTGVSIILVTAFYWSELRTIVAIASHVLSFLVVFMLDGLLPEAFPDLIRLSAMYIILSLMINSTTRLMWNEITTIEDEAEKRELEHQRLIALINSMGDGVIATDENGLIVTYNGAALELLDTNESINGKPLDEVVQLRNDQDQLVNIINDIKQQNRNVRRSDLKIVFAEGDYMNLYLSISPIKIGYGSEAMRGYTLIIRDITKEKSLEQERDEFISVISHELRTPITIAEGKISNAQLLNDQEIHNQKMAESLDASHKQTIMLASMLNDMSNLARAERNDIELNLENINPSDIVKELVKNYEIQARQKNLELITQVEPNLPPLITSRLYLSEIMQNFMTNALKYTKQGSITISAFSPNDKEISFSVKDTGIGISRSDQAKIFKKFFRSENYETRESSGTGLGLYLTLKLAQKIHARIDVDSHIKIGSTFTLTIASMPELTRRRVVLEPDTEDLSPIQKPNISD